MKSYESLQNIINNKNKSIQSSYKSNNQILKMSDYMSEDH